MTRWGGLMDSEGFAALQAEFAAQLKEEAELNKAILDNLKKINV